MPTHWTPELEKLKAATRVVADRSRYHSRTPAKEAWCGAEAPEDGWNLIPLLEAEGDLRLFPCNACFNLGFPEARQERLNFD